MMKEFDRPNDSLIKAIEAYKQATKEWYQLTHIRNDPRLNDLVTFGEEALPILFDGLESGNLSFWLPIREILDDMDVEIFPDVTIEDGEGIYGVYEEYRKPALEWWKERNNTDRG